MSEPPSEPEPTEPAASWSWPGWAGFLIAVGADVLMTSGRRSG